MRALVEPPQPPARTTARKCCARNARLSLRLADGASSMRMRLKTMDRALPSPGCSGAISRLASRD
eukprot:5470493-Pleurochrysis_carterae.AAC.1